MKEGGKMKYSLNRISKVCLLYYYYCVIIFVFFFFFCYCIVDESLMSRYHLLHKNKVEKFC